MKLLHILNEINFSGAEIMLNVAAPIFLKKGIELYILSTGQNIGNYAFILENSGYKIYHIPFKKSFNYFYQLFGLLKKEKFDVVHIHTERAFIWYALIARLVGTKKIIRTIHSVFQYKGLLRKRKSLERFVAREFLKVRFHAIGDSVERNEIGRLNNQTTKIYNWIDENKFYPLLSKKEKDKFRQEIGMPNDSFVIISVGSCTKLKRHSVIINALKYLSKITKDIFYLHIGTGKLLDDEIRLAEDNKLTDRIIFVGQTTNIRDYLIASDIFIMLSEYEGLSTTLLEVIYCGLPVIVNDAPGLIDLVTNGFNGLIIDNLDDLP